MPCPTPRSASRPASGLALPPAPGPERRAPRHQQTRTNHGPATQAHTCAGRLTQAICKRPTSVLLNLPAHRLAARYLSVVYWDKMWPACVVASRPDISSTRIGCGTRPETFGFTGGC